MKKNSLSPLRALPFLLLCVLAVVTIVVRSRSMLTASSGTGGAGCCFNPGPDNGGCAPWGGTTKECKDEGGVAWDGSKSVCDIICTNLPPNSAAGGSAKSDSSEGNSSSKGGSSSSEVTGYCCAGDVFLHACALQSGTSDPKSDYTKETCEKDGNTNHDYFMPGAPGLSKGDCSNKCTAMQNSSEGDSSSSDMVCCHAIKDSTGKEKYAWTTRTNCEDNHDGSVIEEDTSMCNASSSSEASSGHSSSAHSSSNHSASGHSSSEREGFCCVHHTGGERTECYSQNDNNDIPTPVSFKEGQCEGMNEGNSPGTYTFIPGKDLSYPACQDICEAGSSSSNVSSSEKSSSSHSSDSSSSSSEQMVTWCTVVKSGKDVVDVLDGPHTVHGSNADEIIAFVYGCKGCEAVDNNGNCSIDCAIAPGKTNPACPNLQSGTDTSAHGNTSDGSGTSDQGTSDQGTSDEGTSDGGGSSGEGNTSSEPLGGCCDIGASTCMAVGITQNDCTTYTGADQETQQPWVEGETQDACDARCSGTSSSEASSGNSSSSEGSSSSGCQDYLCPHNANPDSTLMCTTGGGDGDNAIIFCHDDWTRDADKAFCMGLCSKIAVDALCCPKGGGTCAIQTGGACTDKDGTAILIETNADKTVKQGTVDACAAAGCPTLGAVKR